MHRHPVTVLSAAAVVAALGLSGCSNDESGPASSSPTTAPLTPAAAQSAPLPPPEALTDVLYRLSDPAVPGTQKLDLIEGATPDKAPVLDKFATALLDGGYAPTTFNAREVRWSDRRPADVTATVEATSPNPGVTGFSFPMEFKPHQGSWQLSERTAEMLLAFGTPTP